MNKKGNKILLITAIILLLVIVFIVYYFFFGSLSNKSIKYNNPKKLVEGYVESIINEDYKESIKYIYLPYNSFVNKKDFEKYIKTRYYYGDISNMKIDSISDDDSNEFNLVLSDKDGNTIKMTVNVIERTINDYRIDESNIYIENYFFSVPSNTTVYIDDYEVNKELIAKKSNNLDYYLLPAIANNEKEFKLVNKLSTNVIKVTPTESDEAYKISIVLNDEELKNKAYDYIKTTWNSMYTSYSNGDKVSSVMKYFDDKFDEAAVKKYYSKGFKNISTGLTSIGKFQNYSIKEIVSHANETSKILSDELIKVNFGYTLKWKWKYIGANSAVKMSMNRYSSIVLKVKDDSFVIYDITDEGLFNYASQYTRDF